MATGPEDDVVALIHRLVQAGETFSISLEPPDSPAVRRAQAHGHDFSFTKGDGKCIEWMQVPGKGVVCIRHEP